jgi:hypothetical protein
MSLTSYRAAPPRANISGPNGPNKKAAARLPGSGFKHCEWVPASRRQQSLATTYSSIA